MPKLWLEEGCLMFDVSLLEWHGQCCQHLSALLSRGSSKFGILKSQVTKPIWWGACSEESQTVLTLCVPNFLCPSLSCSMTSKVVGAALHNLGVAYLVERTQWRYIRKPSPPNMNRKLLKLATHNMACKGAKISVQKVDNLLERLTIVLTESGMCMLFPVWDIINPQHRIIGMSGTVKSEPETFSWTS